MTRHCPMIGGFLLISVLAACNPSDRTSADDAPGATEGAEAVLDAPSLTWQAVQDSTDRVASVTGFSGPEAVRYDPDQDVYFVANFGEGDGRDADGFISRVSAEGTIQTLAFMTGSEEASLHEPRGMNISGDTLWAADMDGVHGFNRRTGAHLAFVDLSGFAPGFLNDIALGPDGALYVTDTGSPARVYRVANGAAEIAIEDPALGPPNGITWDADGARFLLAPWGPDGNVNAWRPGTTELTPLAHAPAGQIDGIEVVDGRILVASQSDGRLHVLEGGALREVVRVPGDPADIGVDTRRMRVAVPYIALNRVDIWQLR